MSERVLCVLLCLVACVSAKRLVFETGTALPQEDPEYLERCYQVFVERKEREKGDCDGLMDCTKCYGELGCFSSGGAFLEWPYRPVSFLPADREHINTQFLLYTRDNPIRQQFLRANDHDSVQNSNFLASTQQGTKIIIHGFIDDSDVEWVQDMKEALLIQGDANVIIVEWSSGSMLPYTLATANTRLVGAEIALLVNYLIDEFGLEAGDVHIIGHSLGAHTAGYAGERITNLGRITGMDPADPYFQGTQPEVRLDPTDAVFVDVIHTDSKPFITGIITSLQGFGAEQPMGHLDFYPNGGSYQPGCDKSNVFSVILSDGLTNGLRHFAACQHDRAVLLMTDSILHPREYTAYRCNNYDNFKSGLCITCDYQCMAQMGISANKADALGSTEVKLFLDTVGEKPFGVFHYEVKIRLSENGNRDEEGDVYIQIMGSSGNTENVKITHEIQDLVHGQTYTYLLTTPVDIGDFDHVTFHWECQSTLWNPFTWCSFRIPEILLDTITITHGQDQQRVTYCSGRHHIASGVRKTFSDNDRC